MSGTFKVRVPDTLRRLRGDYALHPGERLDLDLADSLDVAWPGMAAAGVQRIGDL